MTAVDATRVMRASGPSERALFGLSTLAVWSHTIDEVRIGELIAVPAALATGTLLVLWRRTGRTKRGIFGGLLGLVWVSGAIPYHLMPLLQGVTSWQNISGLQQLAGGLGILALSTRTLYRRRAETRPQVR